MGGGKCGHTVGRGWIGASGAVAGQREEQVDSVRSLAARLLALKVIRERSHAPAMLGNAKSPTGRAERFTARERARACESVRERVEACEIVRDIVRQWKVSDSTAAEAGLSRRQLRRAQKRVQLRRARIRFQLRRARIRFRFTRRGKSGRSARLITIRSKASRAGGPSVPPPSLLISTTGVREYRCDRWVSCQNRKEMRPKVGDMIQKREKGAACGAAAWGSRIGCSMRVKDRLRMWCCSMRVKDVLRMWCGVFLLSLMADDESRKG